jgi:prophage regulatory protein
MGGNSRSEVRILRRHEVEKTVGLSRSTIYFLMSRNEFPRPVGLGSRAVGWLADEVEAWIENRVRQHRRGSVSADLPLGVPQFVSPNR